MKEGFEDWARAEIVRLRREADMLEMLLVRYHGSDAEHVSRPASPGLRRNAPLMRALEDAGDQGLTLEDVVAVAGRSGLGERRAAVRSFLWNHVRAGRIVLAGSRYVAAGHAGAAASTSPGREGQASDETGAADRSP